MHDSVDEWLGATRLVANPTDYRQENKSGFNPALCMELEEVEDLESEALLRRECAEPIRAREPRRSRFRGRMPVCNPSVRHVRPRRLRHRARDGPVCGSEEAGRGRLHIAAGACPSLPPAPRQGRRRVGSDRHRVRSSRSRALAGGTALSAHRPARRLRKRSVPVARARPARHRPVARRARPERHTRRSGPDLANGGIDPPECTPSTRRRLPKVMRRSMSMEVEPAAHDALASILAQAPGELRAVDITPPCRHRPPGRSGLPTSSSCGRARAR